MAVSPRLTPCDRLVAGYNAILALVWIPWMGTAAHASWIAAAHVAGASLPWLLARAPSRPSGLAAALRELYPMILAAGAWAEIDVFRRTVAPHNYDHLIAPLDRALFGRHLHEVWMPAMDAVWFSETMYFLYGAYYALIVLPLIVVAVQGRQAALRDMVFRLIVAYLACYLIYIPFPVDGPHFLYEPHQGPHTQGLVYRLVGWIQGSGDSLGCAFPSSHVTGAVAIAVSGWRWFSRPVALVLTLEAAGVAVSTFYTQNHYAIDSIAGVVVGLALQLAAVPWLNRVLGGADLRLPERVGGAGPRRAVPRPVGSPEASAQ
ncbi:MAG TPA: phosphatase PAP2 family protein [Gemmatimonadales bacterium]|nr:phosphatase PAP2 family protein [Gemmatimonadales bacterium]